MNRFSILAAVCLTFSPLARAQPMGPPPGGPFGMGEIGHAMMLLHGLDLTSDQEAQIHALVKASRTQTESLLTQLSAGHEALNAKLYAAGSGPSLSDLSAQQSQLTQLHAQLDLAELQTFLKIRALLTSDQLSRLSSLHAQLESLRKQTDALLKPDAPPGVPCGREP